MVQAIDSNNTNRSNYSAVKINIQKPEVNGVANDIQTNDKVNGDYSAVSINIDNPTVNMPNHKIYDYPKAQVPITYDMANINQIPLPQGFNFAYQTTNLILPNMENELEISSNENEDDKKVDEENLEDLVSVNNSEDNKESRDAVSKEIENNNAESTKIEVPAPNPTTIDLEKSEDTTLDNINGDVKIIKTETKEIKRPEIIPEEEIKPDVDIPLVIENLTNSDFDVQAQQMEEIARVSLEDSQNAIPFIVRDVFSSLIDITKKDSAELAAPTDEQIQARKKVIANFVSMENDKNNNQSEKLPYVITEKDLALADSISPMEQAERNKEYALYTIAILAKVYTDEVQKQTDNIIPMTDVPGTSAIVDTLRYNPNSGVKIAAIDALRHIYRPEYKDEMSTLFTLAQADTNPEVAIAATRALDNINNQQ